MAEEQQGTNVLHEYEKFKREANPELAKIGPAYILAVPRFDPATGSPADPMIIPVTRKAVEDEVKVLQAKIDSCRAILKDLDAADAA